MHKTYLRATVEQGIENAYTEHLRFSTGKNRVRQARSIGRELAVDVVPECGCLSVARQPPRRLTPGNRLTQPLHQGLEVHLREVAAIGKLFAPLRTDPNKPVEKAVGHINGRG